VVYTLAMLCTFNMAHTAVMERFFFKESIPFSQALSPPVCGYHCLGVLTVNERRYHYSDYAYKPT
jgi:hypothetical protein